MQQKQQLVEKPFSAIFNKKAESKIPEGDLLIVFNGFTHKDNRRRSVQPCAVLQSDIVYIESERGATYLRLCHWKTYRDAWRMENLLRGPFIDIPGHVLKDKMNTARARGDKILNLTEDKTGETKIKLAPSVVKLGIGG